MAPGNRIPLDQRARTGVASAQFKCEWPNCTYIALRRSHLIQHELTHTGARPFGTSTCTPYRCIALLALIIGRLRSACTWPNCTYRASRNATLAEHMRTHTGHRYVPSQASIFSTPSHNFSRRRLCRSRRPFKCTFPGCSYAAAQRTTLSSHMRRHRKR